MWPSAALISTVVLGGAGPGRRYRTGLPPGDFHADAELPARRKRHLLMAWLVGVAMTPIYRSPPAPDAEL